MCTYCNSKTTIGELKNNSDSANQISADKLMAEIDDYIVAKTRERDAGAVKSDTKSQQGK